MATGTTYVAYRMPSSHIFIDAPTLVNLLPI